MGMVAFVHHPSDLRFGLGAELRERQLQLRKELFTSLRQPQPHNGSVPGPVGAPRPRWVVRQILVGGAT